jgi:ATP-binding cassette subfamily B protein
VDVRLLKFLSYYKPYRGLLAADLICAFVVAGIALLLPLAARQTTELVLNAPSPDLLGSVALIGAVMVALVIAQTLCNLFVDYRGHMMGALIERDMRAEVFAHYQKLSFRFYDDRKTGQLMTHITSDLFDVSELCHHAPEDLAIAAISFVGVFLILFGIDVDMALVIFAFMPLMAAYALHFHRRMMRATRRSRDYIGDINAQVEDTLSGIRVVKSFTNEAVERAKFDAANAGFVGSRRELHRAEAFFSGGMLAFTQLITIAAILVGAVGIVNGGISAPDLVTVLMCVAILIEPIQRALNLSRLLQEGVTGFNRVMDVLEIAPDIVDAPDAVELKAVRGEIAFVDVSFRYREGQENVLDHVSLHIRPGEYVALVGTSGVGKTTLCSLIPRFYEVSGGAILLDGHDIRRVTLASLRRQVGVVQQDVYLFNGTVADNIRYGKLDASDAEIAAAAKKANAHDFIMALPDGYDTDIGQRGVKLSGGQKQRLSIARAFLKDPPIIIFDEATSSLDNESERAVQESLEQLTHNRTMIVIAHRLSTIRNASRIIVLTDTGISEQGTHDELIAADGAYAALYAVARV